MTILHIQHNGYALILNEITVEDYEETAKEWNTPPKHESQPDIPTTLTDKYVKTKSRGVWWVNFYVPIVDGNINEVLKDLSEFRFSSYSSSKGRFIPIKNLTKDLKALGFADVNENALIRVYN